MKILHILGSIPVGGVGNYLKNIINNINPNIKNEFLITSNARSGSFVDYMLNKNNQVYFIPQISVKNLIESKNNFGKFFQKNNDFDIVELHSMNMSFFCLKAIKRYTKAKIIVHIHSTKYSNDDTFIKNSRNKILSYPMYKYADSFISCGNLVKETILNNHKTKKVSVLVMPNPIKAVEKHLISTQYIDMLNVKNKKVCLAVGNLLPTKNYKYLFHVFELLKDKNIVLLVAGEGSLRCKLEELIKEKSLNNVILLGYRNDVDKLLNIADLVVLPSLFEGLPVITLEAQSLGVPLIVSNTISDEIKINNNVTFLPIDEESQVLWANKIIEYSNITHETSEKFEKSKFNIDKSIKILEQFYSNLCNN